MIQPSLEKFKEIAGQGSVIPVCKDILGDLLTPAAAFLRSSKVPANCWEPGNRAWLRVGGGR